VFQREVKTRRIPRSAAFFRPILERIQRDNRQASTSLTEISTLPQLTHR